MRDELDAREQELSAHLRTYVAEAVVQRQPEKVVASVLASRPRSAFLLPRFPLVPLAALLVAVTVGAAAIGYLGTESASSPATAVVGGLEYQMAAARSLDLPSSALEPYGSATQIQADAALFDGLTVYAVRGVDPATVLVLKLMPDARDDAGSLGEVFLLIRGPDAFRSLCPYFEPSNEATPRDCR